MKRLLLLAVFVCVASFAADNGGDDPFPPGSIRTREQAGAALQAAAARAAQIERSYKEELARCATTVFVTGCENDARRARAAQMRVVERWRVEARDLNRKLDAQERARARAEAQAGRAAEARLRAQREAKARAAYEARQRAAQQGQPPKPAAPAASQAGAAPDRLTPAERAENVKRLEEKRRAAAEYAKRKAVEREQNAQARARRRQEREAEAQRRAAETAK